ncbi:MAG TPA: ATP-binding protein [Acidimicrobiales bacterium]|nr:ATP-binding protein [Acidimicrobiales bacterium]
MADKDEVRLVVPASPEFVRLARVTASGLASRLGFSYDEIEDLRLAVDELCYAVIGPAGRPGALTVRFFIREGGLEVEGTGHFDPGGPPVGLSDLSHQILTALVDSHDVRADLDGQPSVWLRKRGRAAEAG